MSMSELVERVYGDHEPDWAVGNLYVILARLKKHWLPQHLPWLTIVNRGRVVRLVLRRPKEETWKTPS